MILFGDNLSLYEKMTADGVILPPMLSPTLPSDWELPEPLSPTIPSEFDLEPKRGADGEPTESTPAASTAGVRATVKKKATNGEVARKSLSTSSLDSKPKKPVETKRRIVILKYPPQKPIDDDPKYKALRSKMHHWVERARSKKHEADAAMGNRQHHQAAVAGLDSAICFIRAFDLEDRAQKVVNRDLHVKSWSTLVPYLAKMATYLESVDSDIAGMCYQVLAVVNIRIMLHGGRESPLAAKRAIQEFRRGLALLPFSLLEEKYSLGWTASKLNPNGCDPLNDRALLPLHVNTNPQEAAALALHMGREWASQEGIPYTWDAQAAL